MFAFSIVYDSGPCKSTQSGPVCRDAGYITRTIVYSVHDHDLVESPWLWDVNRGDSYVLITFDD